MCAWATSTDNGNGVLRVPQRLGCNIEAVCTSFPDVSSREYWEVLSIGFTAYDPYFEADEAKAFDIPTNGRLYQDISNCDDLRWVLYFTPDAASGSPTWTHYQDHITLQNVTPAQITIDSKTKTVKQSSASIMAKMDIGSRFPTFLTRGRYVDVRASDGAGGRIVVYERWL